MNQRPVFTPIQTGGDGMLDRVQQALARSFVTLEQILNGVAFPGIAVVTGDYIVTDERVVDYRGKGGHRIRLPSGDSAGVAKAKAVTVMNHGLGAVNIAAPPGGDINGADTLSVPVGGGGIAEANGLKSWAGIGFARAGVGGHIIQAAEVDEPQRGRLDFSSGFTVTDDVANDRTKVSVTGLTLTNYWFSPVDQAAAVDAFNSVYVLSISQTGQITYGSKFSSSKDIVCRGVRFYWKNPGSSLTIRCRIWRIQRSGGTNLGVSIANVDISVSATGIYTGTFGSPVTLSKYVTYIATVMETSGHWTTETDGGGSTGPMGQIPVIGMVPLGPYTFCHSLQRFATGDLAPVNTSANIYPVEPVLDPSVLG